MATHQTTTGVHARLWDYGTAWICEIMSLTYRAKYGRSGKEVLTGDTPDISNYTDFTFYSPVWFWKSPFCPRATRTREMAGSCTRHWDWYSVLLGNRRQRKSALPLERTERHQVDRIKNFFEELDKDINAKLDDDDHYTDVSVDHDEFRLEDAYNDVPEPHYGSYLPDVDHLEATDGYDEYIGAQLIFDLGVSQD